MGSVHRDLASHDVWSHSLQRSHERRTRAGMRPADHGRGDAAGRAARPDRPRGLAALALARERAPRGRLDRASSSAPPPRAACRSPRCSASSVSRRCRWAPRWSTRPTAEAKPAVRHRKGGGVKKLQRALGIGADGVFGPQTKRALKRWQRSHGLTADGIAGPATRSALGIGAGPVLKREGRRAAGQGPHTQGKLPRGRRRGRHAARARHPRRRRVRPADRTVALKRFQARRGLVADGVAGPGNAAGARHRRGQDAQARRPRWRWRQLRDPARDRGRQPDRPQAVQVRRRPRLVP